MSDGEHLCMFVGCICLSSLEKYLFRSSTHVLIWVVCFSDIELHELLVYFGDYKPLSVASFAIIFFHSEGCLFILFMVSFVVQKLLSLIRSHLFIFISISVGDRSKKLML